jgi:TonB family protein
VNDALKPYLARSFAAHLFIVAGFLYFVARPAARVDKVYMIDFVGGTTATIASAGPAAAAASKAAPAPSEIAAQADPDSIAVKGKRHGPIALPRPSLLRGGGKEADAGAATSGSLAGPGANSPTAAPSGSAGAGAGASAGAGVSTDLPNFPYQWYITRMRVMLWQAWQQRMPRMDAEGDVVFSILPNGSFTDLEVESSSGDRDFDKAALDSVQAAAPFPALPIDFHEPFLKIHLKLKSEEAAR